MCQQSTFIGICRYTFRQQYMQSKKRFGNAGYSDLRFDLTKRLETKHQTLYLQL